MLDGNGKRGGDESDAAKMEQLLEIELMQKRAAWQQAKARRGSLRALSFFFLFLVVLAALVGFFVFLSPDRLSDLRSGAPASEVTPSPEPQ